MIYLLSWMLIGSIYINIIWVIKYKLILNDFYYWKEEKTQRYSIIDYLKGVLFGLLLGPFVLLFIKTNKETNYEEDFSE